MAAKKRFQSLFISFQAHAHVRLLVFFSFCAHVTSQIVFFFRLEYNWKSRAKSLLRDFCVCHKRLVCI